MPMNYPNFYPSYPSYYGTTPTPTQPATPQTQNSITWVQGESGAKSYLVGAGSSVLLMDSEQSRFYIKSTDTSGMPLPLRTFEYNEIKDEPVRAAQTDASDFVTRKEFEERLSDLVERPKTKKGGDSDAKSTI